MSWAFIPQLCSPFFNRLLYISRFFFPFQKSRHHRDFTASPTESLSTAAPPPGKWEPQPTDDYDADEERILTQESKFFEKEREKWKKKRTRGN